MLSTHEHITVEDASQDLLQYVLDPMNWVVFSRPDQEASASPGQTPHFQRRVGKLRICASVDVTVKNVTYLRIAFRGPGLSPMRAADHLESFLKTRLPLTPNTEWSVEMDDRNWIHFSRRYTSLSLQA